MRRRALLAAAVLLSTGAAAAALAWSQLDGLVRWRLERAVPGLTVGHVGVGWRRLELARVRLERDGVAVLEVAAATALWHPRSLLSRTVRLDLLELDAPVVRLERSAQGRLALPLPPGALAPSAGGDSAPTWRVAVARLRVQRGRVELVDASGPSPVTRLGLEGVALTAQGLVLPRGAERIEVVVDAGLDQASPGMLRARGWYEPGPQRGDAEVEVRGLSLPAIEPWLRSADTTAALESGTLDLRTRVAARGGRWAARGHVALERVRVAPTGGFWGAPADVVNAAFERAGRLESDFALDGALGEPPDLRRTLATAVAQALESDGPPGPVESMVLEQIRSLVPLPGGIQEFLGP